jgi:glycoprotein endo-alpha-1,2-mannosidase
MLHFNGRLVVYLYATFSRHTPEDWTAICEALEKSGTRKKLFLVAGEIWVHRPGFTQPGLFDGYSAYNQGPDFLDPNGIADLARTLKADAERNKAPFWAATLEPGFEGRIWHHPGRSVTRGMGRLYESLWKALLEIRPPMITVCSFNEWGEGTQIEPCLEYEDLYLKLTRKWAARYKESRGLS